MESVTVGQGVSSAPRWWGRTRSIDPRYLIAFLITLVLVPTVYTIFEEGFSGMFRRFRRASQRVEV